MASEDTIPASRLETGMQFVLMPESISAIAQSYPAMYRPHIAVARHQLMTGAPGQRWEDAYAYSMPPDTLQHRMIITDQEPRFFQGVALRSETLVRVIGCARPNSGPSTYLSAETISVLRVLAWHADHMSEWEPVVRAETAEPYQFDTAVANLVDLGMAMRWRAGNVFRLELTGLGVAEVIRRGLFYV